MKRGIPVLVTLMALAACKPAEVTDLGPQEPPTFEREVKGGRFLKAPAAATTLEALIAASRSDVPLGALDAADFDVVVHENDSMLEYVSARQAIDGIPVEGTWLNYTMRGGEIVSSSWKLYQGPTIDTAPAITQIEGEDIARGTLRLAQNGVSGSELVVRPMNGRLRLAWRVSVEGAWLKVYVLANGTDAGKAVVIDDRIFETASGTARAWVSTNGAPGGSDVVQLQPLSNLRINGQGATAYTDDAGAFSFDVPAGSTLDASLAGQASIIQDQSGAPLSASGMASSNVDLTFAMETSGEMQLAQTTAYHFVDRSFAYLEANGIPMTNLGELTTNVNINDVCNAYFMPSARTINFFRAGTVSGFTCNNSAEGSIVAHEYGHFVDDTFGGITEGGLSEGWGDVLACYLLNDPIVGGDLFTDGSIIRTCDNAYQYPANGSDEVHNLGQAWAGYAWHARQNLMTSLGAEAGDAKARALFLPSLVSNAADIPAAVRETILRDDDDGDLANHTPNWDALYAAASQHALGWVFESDLNPPAPITDLAASDVKATSATLTWTATGDDGMTGTAAAYDLRWSLYPITDATFPSSGQIPTAAPLPAGSAQQLTISIAPEMTVYFAMKVVDEQGNASPISTSVQVTTPAAIPVWTDGAENGLGSWTATGLWHATQRRAASGTSSFWYGQEATGNYDTGATNSGSLTTPVIDLAGANAPLLALSDFVDVESYAQFDVLTITISVVGDTAGTMTASIPKDTGSTSGQFRTRMWSLAGYEDRQIQIRFDFDTVDNLYNTYEGWFLDDVKLLAESIDQPEPEPTPEPATAALVINEVLADPPANYDANKDGAYSSRNDEFIELVNAGSAALDLSGAQISDAIAIRHTFAAGTTLAPGEVLVVFGGGMPNLPGIRTVATAGLLLNNDGDTVRIHRADGELLAEMTYGANGGQDTSLVRTQESDPTSPFIRHNLKIAGTIASAGTHSDGTPFSAGKLVLNEVLADPKSAYDANGDGVYSATDDEFVELVNAGDSSLDLSGTTISDSLGVRVTLPEGMTLGPRKTLVVFGGGTPALSIPGVTAMRGTARLNLNNDGDSVTIKNAAGTTLDAMSYGANGGQDKSLVRSIELDALSAWIQHPDLAGQFASPGTRKDGSAL